MRGKMWERVTVQKWGPVRGMKMEKVRDRRWG
jgi:hypothetical protein